MAPRLVPDKETLRRHFRAFRGQLSPAAYAARSAAIVAQAQTLPELQHARTVHCFWPVLERREVDVRPLITWLQHSGKQIVLPVVVSFSKQASGRPRLRHARYEAGDVLHPNQWGLHEPATGKSVPLTELDVILVPALGAGRNSHRVGHGYGYYDEFLRSLRVPTVCPVFTECLVEAVPAETHDVPISVIITEEEIIRPTPGVTS